MSTDVSKKKRPVVKSFPLFWGQRKYLPGVIIFELIALCLLIIFLLWNNGKEPASLTTAISQKDNFLISETVDKAFIYTYLKAIKNASDDFYSDYYYIAPTISYYSVFLKEVKALGNNTSQISITFHTLPYLGPHDTIGEDEITFLTDYTGKVELKQFKHLKSYDLPRNLQDLEKKKPEPDDGSRNKLPLSNFLYG